MNLLHLKFKGVNYRNILIKAFLAVFAFCMASFPSNSKYVE